jgi:hypothetical protein
MIKKRNKAQMKISFQLIFAVILIIFFIIFGFFGIKKFISIQEDIQSKKLVSDIQDEINNLNKNSRASQEKTFSVPKNVEQICFQNRESDSEEPNIYSIPLGIVDGEISGVYWFNTNPGGEILCVEVENKKILLRFEKDYGENEVSLSKGGEFVSEELISQPGNYGAGGGSGPVGIGSISREELLNNLPLKISSSGRYLEIQNGKPFLLNGDTAWSLIVQLSKEDADYYLNKRAESGFNSISVMLIATQHSKNHPNNFYNDAPFTGRAFVTPNEEYFEHVDYVINSAREKGFVVLLVPFWLGWGCSDDGWCPEVKQASESDMLSWGRYLGNRYKNYDNIIWLVGGDVDPSPVKNKVESFIQGLKEDNPNALISFHNKRGQMAVDTWGNADWLNVNDVYPTTLGLVEQSKRAYELSPKKPFFMVEGYYENSKHSMNDVKLRSQFYWTMLSGGFGHVFGNCPMWSFNAPPREYFCPDEGSWKGELSSSGTQSMTHAKNFFDSTNWNLLIPDFNHNVLVSGYGNLGSFNYATAAKTSDNLMIVVYTPEKKTLKVNTNILSREDIRYRWYNPRTGTYTDYEDCEKSSSESFSPPSSGDWVLVIESYTISSSTGNSELITPFSTEISQLKVDSSGNYLVKSDGSPFFYLADTAWKLPQRLNRQEIDSYLQKRKSQGFNVIMIAPGYGIDSSNAYGHYAYENNDFDNPRVVSGSNNDYWDHLDYIIKKADELGLYVSIIPIWSNHYGSESESTYRNIGEFYGNRYKDYDNIIWIMGGDIRPNGMENKFRAMAEEITRQITGSTLDSNKKVLITYHPCGWYEDQGHPHTSSISLHNANWLDMNGIQSGHYDASSPPLLNYKYIETDYAKSPKKPTSEMESLYEGHYFKNSLSYRKGDAFDVRRNAYWSVFAGGYGYTYGNNNIWPFYLESMGDLKHHQDTNWKEALDSLGANDMIHLRNLMESKGTQGYLRRIPDQSMILNSNPDNEYKIYAMRDSQGSYAFVYIPSSGKTVKMDTSKMSGNKIISKWYNPRDGTYIEIDEITKPSQRTYTTPSSGEDWVLVIESVRENQNLGSGNCQGNPGEFLILDEVFTIPSETNSNHGGNGFWWWKEIPSNWPNNWRSPYDYYNGDVYSRYEVISQPTNNKGEISFVFWQKDIDNDGDKSEEVEKKTSFSGPGVYTQSSSPVNWWKHTSYGGIDWKRMEDIDRFGFATWKSSPFCQLSSWGSGCPEYKNDYFPLKIHVTMVAVPEGGSFSGWDCWIEGSTGGSGGFTGGVVSEDFDFEHHYITQDMYTKTGNGVQTAGDYDNDGDLDFTIGSRYSPTGMYWYENTQNGNYWINHKISANIPVISLGGADYDVDEDGWEDIISSKVWYENNKDGTFTERTYDPSMTSSDEYHDIFLIDMNNDDVLDVVTWGAKSGSYWYDFSDNPRGSWEKHNIEPNLPYWRQQGNELHGAVSPSGVGDLDGDGDNDVWGTVAWYENRNNGNSFTRHSLDYTGQLFTGELPYGKSTRTFIIDIDNDGDNDIVFSECDDEDSRAGIIKNNGNTGSFSLELLPKTLSGRRGSLHSLNVGDLNMDGHLEIITVEQEDINVGSTAWYVWTNTGNGWKEQVLFDIGLGGHDSIFKDVDQDGDIDIISKVWNPKQGHNILGGAAHADYYENKIIEQSSDGIRFSSNINNGWTQRGGAYWETKGDVIIARQNNNQGGELISQQSFSDFEVVFDAWPDYSVDTGIYVRATDDGKGYQVTIDYQPGNPIGGIWLAGIGDTGEWDFEVKNKNEIKESRWGDTPKYFDIDAWSYIWKENDWNQFRVRVEGNPPKITTWINGWKVYDYQDTQERLPSNGKIALQVHDGADDYTWEQGAVARFRNIKVYPL